MDFFTHLIIGMVTALVTLKKFDEEYILLGIIMAILPDADLLLIPIVKLTKSYYLSHRGGSHSYIVGMLISPIVALIFVNIYGGPFLFYFIIGALFYSVHITLDLLTTSRIPIFYPLSKKEFRLSADRAVNPLVMLFSFFVVIFSLWLSFSGAKYGIRLFYRNLFFIIYYVYFTYRFATKSILWFTLEKNQIFIPGLYPFVYYIYEKIENKHEITFKLTKKVQFLSFKKVEFEKRINKKNYEIELYKKALEKSKDYRFFSKWEAVVPLIKETESHIILIIFLMESYSHGSSYFIEYTFDKDSREIINERDGFHFIKIVEKT